MDNPEVIISLKGISFVYHGNQSQRLVLDDLNLQISRGDRVGLIGLIYGMASLQWIILK